MRGLRRETQRADSPRIAPWRRDQMRRLIVQVTPQLDKLWAGNCRGDHSGRRPDRGRHRRQRTTRSPPPRTSTVRRIVVDAQCRTSIAHLCRRRFAALPGPARRGAAGELAHAQDHARCRRQRGGASDSYSAVPSFCPSKRSLYPGVCVPIDAQLCAAAASQSACGLRSRRRAVYSVGINVQRDLAAGPIDRAEIPATRRPSRSGACRSPRC